MFAGPDSAHPKRRKVVSDRLRRTNRRHPTSPPPDTSCRRRRRGLSRALPARWVGGAASRSSITGDHGTCSEATQQVEWAAALLKP